MGEGAWQAGMRQSKRKVKSAHFSVGERCRMNHRGVPRLHLCSAL
jgi:hypothetical protein